MKKKRKKLGRKLLGFLLTLAMVMGLMPGMGLTAQAAGTTWSENQTISSTNTIDGGVTVNSDITLTINENVTLTVNGGINADGHTLTVTGKGSLVVYGPGITEEVQQQPNPCIKGNLTVYSGTVEVTGGTGGIMGGVGIVGHLTVDSGTVTVTGGSGTIMSGHGIDGANPGYEYASSITVNGGTVTVKGGSGSSGGCGVSSAEVTVSGGSFTAIGGNTSGEYFNGGNGVDGKVTVSGGSFTAIGGNASGEDPTVTGGIGVNCDVIVSGGSFTATGGSGQTPGKAVYENAKITCENGAVAEESDNGTAWTAVSGTSSDKRYVKVEAAPPHTHSFTYSVGTGNDANTITAICSATDCPLTDNKATLTIAADGGTYDGTTTYGATVTNNIPAVDGVTVGEIEYYKVSTQGATTGGTKQTGAPTDAGYYYASVTLTSGSNSYTAVKAFTVAPKALTITGATLTARDYAEGNKDVTVSAVTFDNATLTLGTDYTATAEMANDTAGSAKPATVTVTLTNGNYSLAQNTYTGATVQINKIEYTGNKTAAANLRGISGATAEVTLPALPTGASYGAVTNSNTDYFTVGTVADGKVTVTAAKDFNQSTESADKTFTVAVSGATNYNNYTVTVTITPIFKSEQTITAENVTATYGDTGKSVSATTDGDGAISYSVKSGDAVTVDENTGALTIVKSGSAVITVTAAETATYAQATKDVNVTVNKAAPTVTAPTAKSLTYNGQKQELVNAGSTEDGTLYYAVTTENTAPTDENLYTTDIPTATDAGTYYVWYKVVGDADHSDSEAKCLTVIISNKSSGGGSYTPSTPSTPTTPSSTSAPAPTTAPTEDYTVPVTNENAVNVSTSITEGNAVVEEITQSDLDKIVNKNSEPGTEADENTSITIDVSKAKSEVTSIELTKTTIERLADTTSEQNNSVDTVTVQMTNAKVELDAETLAAVSEQADGKRVRLVVDDKLEQASLNEKQRDVISTYEKATTFEAYFESAGKRIHDFKGGTAKVSVRYSLMSGLLARFIHMLYLNPTGEVERFTTTYDGEWCTGDLPHFSEYAIVYDTSVSNKTGTEEDAAEAEKIAKDPYTGMDPEDWDADENDFVADETTILPNGKTAYENGLAINSGLRLIQKGKTLTVTWGKVKGATGYKIYAEYCGTKMPDKPIKTIKNGSKVKVVIKELHGKKLNKKNNYKVCVVAYKTVDGVDKVLGRTVTAHVVGAKNKKYSNPKKLTIVSKTKLSLKQGKSAKIRSKVTLVNKKRKSLSDAHAPMFRYASTNKKVATVNKKGKIKAVGKGQCYIWVYAKNGYGKKVKVTVS